MATKAFFNKSVPRDGKNQSCLPHKLNSVDLVPLFTSKVVHVGSSARRKRLPTVLAAGKLPRSPAVITTSDISVETNNETIESKYTSVENVVVVGSGPAGYTAAIYAGRANLKPLVFEGLSKGGVPGGQLMGTTEVENFPGFPDGITGPDLMDRMRSQAERWGAELILEDVEEVDLNQRPFRIKTTERDIRTHSLILSTGATANRLNLPSESKYWGQGISACAVCDGASPMFRNQVVGVVGGGDTASEEALYLTKYASHIHMFVRSGAMRASKEMQMRVLEHPMITTHYNSKIVDVYSANGPDSEINGVILIDKKTNLETRIPLKGLFYGIGHTPNSDFLNGQVKTDQQGFVITSQGLPATSVEGVFAAGDLQDKEFRQAIVASGSGCMAAMLAERYLTERGLVVDFAKEEESEEKTDAISERGQTNNSTKNSIQEDDFDSSVTKFKGQYALRRLYHETEKPLIVLYTSPGCGPCRSLKPMINKVIDEFENDLKFVEIDIAADTEIAAAAGVTGTPVLHVFKDKARVEEIKGVKMKSEYRKVIQELI